MSLRIVLMTRASRPSGALMAWRLIQSGRTPVAVIVEKRSRMIGQRKESFLKRLIHLGPEFIWKRIREAIKIRSQYILRSLLKDRYKNSAYLSIEELALDYPIRIFEVEDHNHPEVMGLLAQLQSDIGILTNTRRIYEDILSVPKHGFLNLHTSDLPKYAGVDSIFWALYHGEKEIGVTVHRAAAEIDRGDILFQKKIPVGILDNEESLYHKALWLGTHLMIQALKQLEEGALRTVSQTPQEGSYFSWPTSKQRAELSKRRMADNGDSPRILHMITRMTRGGAQENTLASIRAFHQKGYAVSLVTGPSWDPEGEILSTALEEGLDVFVIPELIRDIHPWQDLIAFFKICRLLSKKRFTIVHTHTSKAGFLGRLAARLKKVPILIHTPHGHIFHSYFNSFQEKFYLNLERKAATGCDRLIALTRSERDEHLERKVGMVTQWRVIPSGVPAGKFELSSSADQAMLKSSLGIPSGATMIGFVGRLAPVKGAHILMEALPEICRQRPNVHMLFVGDGEQRAMLEKRVCELKLEDKVTFSGKQEKVSDFFSIIDILIVPSLNEGMGRVIALGGLLEKPVIATKVGGILDLIEDKATGLLVESHQPHKIAQAVAQLLDNPEFSHQLGRALRQKILSGFTEDYMIEKLDELYQNVLKVKDIHFTPFRSGVPDDAEPISLKT